MYAVYGHCPRYMQALGHASTAAATSSSSTAKLAKHRSRLPLVPHAQRTWRPAIGDAAPFDRPCCMRPGLGLDPDLLITLQEAKRVVHSGTPTCIPCRRLGLQPGLVPVPFVSHSLEPRSSAGLEVGDATMAFSCPGHGRPKSWSALGWTLLCCHMTCPWIGKGCKGSRGVR